MDVKAARTEAIEQTIAEVRTIMESGTTIPALEAAKTALMSLCAMEWLFPLADFPGPTGDQTERTYLIHEDNGEFALYVNSGGPNQSAPPHDHGGAWAIVAAISGEETHRLYVDDASGDETRPPAVRQVAELVVKPGTAVSMLPDGIHSIHSASDQLLHLHLYGLSFESQLERRVYDLESGTVRRFVLEDVGFIEDMR